MSFQHHTRPHPDNPHLSNIFFASQLGISCMLRVEDVMTEVDELSIIVYVSQYYFAFRSLTPQQQQQQQQQKQQQQEQQQKHSPSPAITVVKPATATTNTTSITADTTSSSSPSSPPTTTAATATTKVFVQAQRKWSFARPNYNEFVTPPPATTTITNATITANNNNSNSNGTNGTNGNSSNMNETYKNNSSDNSASNINTNNSNNNSSNTNNNSNTSFISNSFLSPPLVSRQESDFDEKTSELRNLLKIAIEDVVSHMTHVKSVIQQITSLDQVLAQRPLVSKIIQIGKVSTNDAMLCADQSWKSCQNFHILFL